MAQGQKQYLVKWEIDITASSPREAAKQAVEIQQDVVSEALAFDVYERATNSETAVNLLAERAEGFDICYGCGTAQEYKTMEDVDETFAIYCEKCLNTTKALKDLEDFRKCLKIDEDVDWDEADIIAEFDTLGLNLEEIIKRIRKNLLDKK